MTTPDRDPQEPERFAKRVLERIERESLTPLPRSRFVLQNVALWVFGALSILFGAIAAAAALFALANEGWRYYVATHDNLLTFIIQTAPFLWLATLAVFILVGYEIFRRTRQGYRYPLFAIALGSIALALALGGALYAFGLGEVFEEGIGTYVPFYQPTIAAEEALWSEPQRGLLAGSVVSLAPDFSSFTLRAFDGSVWTIDGDDLRSFDEAALARGGLVRIVGVPYAATSTATSTASTEPFHACFVFPWEVYGAYPSDHDALPMPFLHIESERNESVERSQECKGVRPYAPLRALEESGQASSSSFFSGS
jgi:hypothetical protein